MCIRDSKNNGKLLVLLYCTAHLAPHQRHWHSYEQELWGLLICKRSRTAQLGRIPAITHTDHANLVRLDALDIVRIDPKHIRWYQEIVEGGSLLLHRPGESTLHRGPDGLSRNCEGRDQLILAKSSEWESHRQTIRGIVASIDAGEADDEDPEMLTMEKLEKDSPEALAPLPPAQGLAVALSYEKGTQERKGKPAARGGKRSQQDESDADDIVKISTELPWEPWPVAAPRSCLLYTSPSPRDS